MTLLRPPEQRSTRRTLVAGWTATAVGAVATVIGLWLRYWSESDLAEAWPFVLIVGGLLAMFAGFDNVAQRVEQPDQTSTWLALAALVSLAAAVVFALIWLL